MRNFSIDIIWAKIQIAITAIGGWLGYFLGGMDGLLIALLVLMVLDYISGIMCAIVDKKLDSRIGFRGICKKVLTLMLGRSGQRRRRTYRRIRQRTAECSDLLLPEQ